MFNLQNHRKTHLEEDGAKQNREAKCDIIDQNLKKKMVFV